MARKDIQIQRIQRPGESGFHQEGGLDYSFKDKEEDLFRVVRIGGSNLGRVSPREWASLPQDFRDAMQVLGEHATEDEATKFLQETRAREGQRKPSVEKLVLRKAVDSGLLLRDTGITIHHPERESKDWRVYEPATGELPQLGVPQEVIDFLDRSPGDLQATGPSGEPLQAFRMEVF